jgi:peptidoglycan/LPS O-acetylase OafA/YrhL
MALVRAPSRDVVVPTSATARNRSRHRPASSNEGGHRIHTLDALRGLAALAVVLFHYTYHFQRLYPAEHHPVVSIGWGHYGIDLFFVISGFVILMTLDTTRRTRDFVVARLSRLFPTYWLAVALTFVVVLIAGLPGREVNGMTAALNLSMLQTFVGRSHVDGVYWTLEVEVGFYVVMLIAFVAGALRRDRLLFTLTAWLILAQMLASLAPRRLPTVLATFIAATGPSYAHVFVAGMAIYVLRSHNEGKTRWVLLLSAMPFIDWWRHGATSALFVLGCVALVLAATSPRVARTQLLPFYALGLISYPLYLIHQNIGYVILRSLPLSPTLSVVATVSVVMILASLITCLVERPAMRLIRSRFGSPGLPQSTRRSNEARTDPGRNGASPRLPE